MKASLSLLLIALVALFTTTLAQTDCQTCEKDVFNCAQICEDSNSTNMAPCAECVFTMIQPCCECAMPNSPYCQLFANMVERMDDSSDCTTCALDAANCAYTCEESNGDYAQCLECVYTMAQPCCDCFFPNSQYCQDIPLQRLLSRMTAQMN